MKNINLNKPWVLNISEKFNKILAQFNNDIEKLKAFYKQFDYDKIPYNGIKRWGIDSSTESSDIMYDDIEEGNEMWWRKYSATGFRWILIKITHKYGGILFFETLNEKNKISSYVDTGANDLEWTGNNKARYSLPKHQFYPIEIIKPEWVDIESWNAPKHMKITNI